MQRDQKYNVTNLKLKPLITIIDLIYWFSVKLFFLFQIRKLVTLLASKFICANNFANILTGLVRNDFLIYFLWFYFLFFFFF